MLKPKKKNAKTNYKHKHDKIIQLNGGRSGWILDKIFTQNLFSLTSLSKS